LIATSAPSLRVVSNFFIRRPRADHFGTAVFCQLHQQRADAARRGKNQDRLSGFHIAQ
jgi:hypothetical protein